ncbi:response regulator [Polyangium aurulentum]|uniref:response regulator n=1 Tax=Polyangium aurulentum TaxID=2567896 RepID=UPI0019821D42|nr:response regulator [Polyangium aurulentum]UQA63399.1 response regulator [Polyangium aurulentum]
MSRIRRETSPLLYVAAAFITAIVVLIDALTPLGFAEWIFYVAPLVLCLFVWRPSIPLYAAAGLSVLMVLGYYLSPPGASIFIARVNRAFGGLVLWGLAIIVRQFILARLEVAKQEWLQVGLTKLGEQLRGEHSPGELGERTLRFFAEYMGAHVGAVYAGEGDTFQRLATWALPAEGDRTTSLRRGEGLAGQAAAEGKLVIVADVPEGHVKLSSTTGESRPRHLALAPVTTEGRVNGVIELGFTQRLGGTDREMFERLAEPIGTALRSALYRKRLEHLLEETKRQAEELQLQQAELEQTNAQLEEQAASLEAQKEELIVAQKTLEASSSAIAQANRYKSEFLANMSHELRTPLNSALILARLLAENKSGNLTPDQVRYAETIYGAGNDLLALINDVLDLSKIEAGKVEIHAQALPMDRLVEPLQRMFTPIAEQKKLGFRIEVDPSAPKVLTTDPQRLQQILKNLLSNALKFTEKGEVALLIGSEPGGRAVFAVKDTGIGIPQHQQQVIFEAFRQADGTTSRKYGGTGLGLSISRELASLLGGEISVQSEPDRGSTFRLSIPAGLDRGSRAAPRPAELPPLPRPRPPEPIAAPIAKPPKSVKPASPEPTRTTNGHPQGANGGRLILVIEDDPAFAQILHDLTRELDFECVLASSAEEGLELARTISPSAVLLDVGLPDGSGLGVLQRLKSDPATRPIPVHVISGADYAQTALTLGAVGYALKPVQREELVAAIRKLEDQFTREVRRVLVAEDDPRQRESIRALLGTQNVEIVDVATAQEALEKLSNGSFDCMVMDLGLEDTSGYELLETMAASEKYAFPPVIVYTGRELGHEDEQRLRRYSKSIIIKGAKSPERLLDEVALFLHQVEAHLPPEQRRLLEQTRSREAAFEGRRILLVEDDVRNIFVLSQILEPRGAKLEVARNGQEALDALERMRDVELVLMDIMMPVMDGLTAMREIRKRPEHARLPIIALTAKAMSDDRQQCLDAGANDYIPKPIDVDKLLSLCRVWMR